MQNDEGQGGMQLTRDWLWTAGAGDAHSQCTLELKAKVLWSAVSLGNVGKRMRNEKGQAACSWPTRLRTAALSTKYVNQIALEVSGMQGQLVGQRARPSRS